MAKPQTPEQRRRAIVKILGESFARKQKLRPEYSRRSLARDLGVSPAFVTGIFSGKKSVPPERIADLARLLELDIPERAELYKLVALGSLAPGLIDVSKESSVLGDRRLHSGVPGTSLLSSWYLLPVLEGLSLKPPLNSESELKRRLGLTPSQWDDAISCLTEAAVIEMRDGVLTKIGDHLYIPSGRSKKEVRSFHEKMILKARDELTQKTSDADFHRRLITGFTLTVKASETEKLKARILEFLSEFSQTATESAGTDVYQCNLQFFPLTFPSGKEGT